jgi:Protein of unknown function (DUF1350)
MKFVPLHFSWAALPPRPKGIIIFLGGAFFGSFPTLFYRGLLHELYSSGYGVVAQPYRFTFRHWDVSISLAIAQAELQNEIRVLLSEQDDPLPPGACIPYFWVAHSLGCKYIALLELLSDSEDMSKREAIVTALAKLSPRQANDLIARLDLIDARCLSLRNQPQVLIDPVITDLRAAIPVKRLEQFFARWLKVEPSRDITFSLITGSALFNLTSILSLASRLACDTVQTLAHIQRPEGCRPIPVQPLDLANPDPPLGRHLAVLGFGTTDPAIRSATIATLERATPQAAQLQGHGTDGSSGQRCLG